MNEEIPALTQPPAAGPSGSPDSAAPAAPPSAERASRSTVALSMALAVLALVAAGVAGWHVWDTRQRTDELREELARRLSVSDTVATEARTLARQQQDALAAVQGKLGALESKVAATEGQAAALESLYQEFSRSREDRALAEIEQAVGIAAQQLELAGNVGAALVALQGAETRLAALDRGQLAALRRALARDIEQLKTLPQVDVPGIALRLENLLAQVDRLPFAFAGSPEASTAKSAPAEAAAVEPTPLDFVRGLARDIWEELKTLVRIERLDQTEPVLLAPEQGTYLRSNLKIRLLTARLALLARDGRTYAADLTQAQQWLERYFDRRDEHVGEALVELEVLRKIPVGADLPPALESAAALRMVQARAGESRTAEPAPAPAPAPGDGQPDGAPDAAGESPESAGPQR